MTYNDKNKYIFCSMTEMCLYVIYNDDKRRKYGLIWREALDELHLSIKNGISKKKVEACCNLRPQNSKQRKVNVGNKRMEELYNKINLSNEGSTSKVKRLINLYEEASKC